MNRQYLLVLAIGLSTAFAACGGGSKPPADDPTIEIIAPQTGASFTVSDDVDTAAEGVQIAVIVAVANFGDLDEVFVSSSGDVGASLSLPLLGEDDPAELTFDAVTLLPGENTLTASLFAESEAVAEVSITVTLTEEVVAPPTLAITSPLDGAQLDQDDDADPATPGLQIVVEAAAENVPTGTEIKLLVNGSELAPANLDGAGVRFEAVTLTEGQNTLRVTADVDGTTLVDEISVTVATGDCAVAVAPAPNPDACEVDSTTPDEDPDTDGLQVSLTVTSDCSDLSISIDGEPFADTTTDDEGNAIVMVTVGEGDTTIEITASEAGRTGTSGTLIYTADTVAPTLAIDPSIDGVITPDTDSDLDTDGLQLDIFGTSDLAATATVELRIDGNDAGTTETATDGSWTFDDVTFAESGTFVIQVSSVDDCGNLGESESRELVVFVTPPTLVITSPDDLTIWNAASDEDAGADGLQGTFVLAGVFPEGTAARVECRPDDAPAGSPFVAVADGEFGPEETATLSTTFEDGAWLCRGLVEAPFRAASAPINLLVDALIPTPEIRQPTEGDLLASTEIDLSVVLTGVSDGETLTVTYSVGDGDPVEATLEDNGFVEVVTVPEGPVSITVNAIDAAANQGTTEVSFTVDVTAPTLTASFPTEGQVVTEGELAGDQLIDATFTVGGTDEGSTLCVSINDSTPTCRGDLVDGDVTVEGLTVLPGENTIIATLTDAAGNPAALELDFIADIDLPRLTIQSPADGSTLNAVAPLEVVVTTDLAEAVDVTLLVNETEWATVATDGVGTATFVDVLLLEGPNTLQATATDDRGTGTSMVTTVTLDTIAPTLAFEAPTDGALFNADSPDASGAVGFQITASVSGDGLEDGQAVTIDVDCDGASGAFVATFVEGLATFDAVTLAQVASCTLTASAFDRAGNAGTATVDVVVDRARPRITWLRPTAGQAITDDSSTDPGIQSFLALSVEDGSIGQTVTIRQESDALDEPLVFETAPLDGLLINVEDYTLSDGVVTLTAWTVDDAGNRSADTAVSVTVVSDLAGALITSPGSGSSVNLSDDISGTPGIQMNVRANVFGAFNELSARLCLATDDAELYPTGCDTVGFRQMALSVVAANEAIFGGVDLPDGRITLIVEIALADGSFVPPVSPTAVLVDSVAPTAEGLSVLGDGNADGLLNRLESDSGGVPATTRIRATFAGIEDGRTATVTTNNPAPGTLLGTGEVGGGSVTVPVTLNQGLHTIEVNVTDAAGNELADGVPTIDIAVDTVDPLIEIAAPGDGARVLAASDLNADPSDGLQYRVVVTTDVVEGRSVVLSTAGAGGALDLGSLAVAGGRAEGERTLPEGTNSITAQVTDTAGNFGTDSNDFFVDSIPPTVAFTAPAGPLSISVDDDLDAGLGGVQIDVTVSVTNAEVGQPIAIRSLLSGAPVSSGETVAGAGPQDIRVTLRAPGSHVLEASVEDVNGNTGTGTSPAIDLALEGCAILFVGLNPAMTWFNAADDLDGDPSNGIDIDIAAIVHDAACVGLTAELLLDGGGVPALTATIQSDLSVLFTGLHLADGAAGTLQARVDDAGDVSTTAIVPYAVDLLPPTIDAIVPGTGDPVLVGRAEASAASGNGFVDFVLDTTGAVGGTLSIEGDTELASVAVDADTVAAHGVALAEGEYALTFTLLDAAGNSVAETLSFRVDWSGPTVTGFVITVENRRSGRSTLSWTYDGDATRYEVRSAHIAITDHNWDEPTTEEVDAVDAPFGVAAGETIELPVVSLEFEQEHFFAVRAIDGVGNESDLATDAVTVGMLTTDIELSAAAISDASWAGDLNNDGFLDLIASGSNQPLQVIYGAEDLTAVSVTPIAPPVGTSFYGIVSHGVGDVNGDGISDILVGAPITSPRGTAYLYFGRDGAPLPDLPDVTIDYSSATASPRFGFTALDGHGDITRLADEAAGSAIDDLLFAATVDNDNAGILFVVAGRETWPSTFTVSSDPEVNHAQGVATILGSVPGGRFGRAAAIPGDVDDGIDGLDDFIVGAYSSTELAAGEIYYFYGRAMVDFPSTGLTAADADQRILGPFEGTFWVADGIGVLPDANGDGAPEWMLWDRNRDALDIFFGADPAPTAASYRYTGTLPPGRDIDFGRSATAVGDVDTLNGEDVVVRVSSGIGSPDDGYFALLLNDGTGDYRLGETIFFEDVDGDRPTGVGDLNSDGFPDFVVVIPGTLSDLALRIYY